MRMSPILGVFFAVVLLLVCPSHAMSPHVRGGIMVSDITTDGASSATSIAARLGAENARIRDEVGDSSEMLSTRSSWGDRKNKKDEGTNVVSKKKDGFRPKTEFSKELLAANDLMELEIPGGHKIEVVFMKAEGYRAEVFGSTLMVWEPSYKPLKSSTERNKLFGYLKHFASKWTKGNLSKYLRRIVVAKDVALSGAKLGGFFYAYPGDTIWVSDSTIDRDEWTQTLQHETAHLVEHALGGSKFVKKWEKLLPTGFKWKSNCGDCGRNYDPSIYEDGFLTRYNMVSVEEDIAQFANSLMEGHKRVWEAAMLYPVVGKKIDLIVELYSKIDKGFTREYFRSIKTNKAVRFASNDFADDLNLPEFLKRGVLFSDANRHVSA